MGCVSVTMSEMFPMCYGTLSCLQDGVGDDISAENFICMKRSLLIVSQRQQARHAYGTFRNVGAFSATEMWSSDSSRSTEELSIVLLHVQDRHGMW